MLSMIKALTRLTFSRPRDAVATLKRMPLAEGAAMQFAVLVVVLGVIASWLYSAAAPVSGNPLIEGLMANPLLLAVVQFMALMLSVLAIFLVGRMFGGQGSFEQTLVVSVWLQFYMLLFQAGLIVMALISPTLADALDMAVFGYMVWLLVNFIAVLHGFTSLWRVFAGIVGTSFLVSFVFIFVLGAIGAGGRGY